MQIIVLIFSIVFSALFASAQPAGSPIALLENAAVTGDQQPVQQTENAGDTTRATPGHTIRMKVNKVVYPAPRPAARGQIKTLPSPCRQVSALSSHLQTQRARLNQLAQRVRSTFGPTMQTLRAPSRHAAQLSSARLTHLAQAGFSQAKQGLRAPITIRQTV